MKKKTFLICSISCIFVHINFNYFFKGLVDIFYYNIFFIVFVKNQDEKRTLLRTKVGIQHFNNL